MKFGKIRKPLFIFCLVASIAVHIGAIWFIYGHPLHLSQSDKLAMMKPSPSPTMITKDDDALMVDKIEKALEQSLNTVVAMNHNTFNLPGAIAKEEEAPFEAKTDEEKVLFANRPKIKATDLIQVAASKEEFSSKMPPAFDPENELNLAEFALEDELDDPFPQKTEKFASIDFSSEQFEDRAPIAGIFQDDYTLTDEQFAPTAADQNKTISSHVTLSLSKLANSSEICETNEKSYFKEMPSDTSPKLILPNSVEYLCNQWVKRSLAEESLHDLEYYGLSEIASSLQWEEDLDVEVQITLDPEQNRYIFSLTVHPDFEADTTAMKQNFYFLIDRSSSIERSKFGRFKRAVNRSLAALCDGDNFNIYIFDKNIQKLSDRTLPVSQKSLNMAEDFLERQQSKTVMAAGDVYTSIEKMLPTRLNLSEIHSVILITDGNTLLSSQKQRQVLSDWAKKYEGNVNFYTAASGRGNNLVLLDLLSYSTGGKLLYSDTNASFPRKLVRLVKDLHNPIVKNVQVDVTPKDKNARVHLFPRKEVLPPMFAGQPYIIVGTVDESCDFTLFLQGRNHEKWLNIRKNISLKNAKSGTRALEKLWANTQSKICYEYFLKNGKASHLKEAKAIVAPYRGVIASEQ